MHSLLNQFGYLDPGTGSIVIQAVVGVVAGVTVFARRRIAPVFYKVRNLFSSQKTRDAKAGKDNDE
jgi:hypothetical protein